MSYSLLAADASNAHDENRPVNDDLASRSNSPNVPDNASSNISTSRPPARSLFPSPEVSTRSLSNFGDGDTDADRPGLSEERQPFSPEHMEPDSPLLRLREHSNVKKGEPSDDQTNVFRPRHDEQDVRDFASQEAVELDSLVVADSNDTRPLKTWLPYTLRSWYMALVLTTTSALTVAVAVLLAKSLRNTGLAVDDGSSSLLFGWRFSPTFLAVLYTELVAMLFEDVLRTEPFALMARTEGGKADSTLLQRPGAWWTILRTATSTKNGKQSWALFLSCFLNVLAFLVIAPLSSSMLTSMDVTIRRDTEFSSLIPKADATISLRPHGDTYFRTISNLLQNVSTSAFITGSYLVFPTWPSTTQTAPLGVRLSNETQTWLTRSLVYQLEYDCVSIQPIRHPNNITVNDPDFDSETPMSLQTQTIDSCSYMVDLPKVGINGKQFLYSGGALWTNPTGSSSDSRLASRCSQDVDIILFTTPWSNTDREKVFRVNANTSLKGHVCSTKVYQGEIDMAILNTPSLTRIDFNETIFERQRVEVSPKSLDVSNIRHLLVDPRWSDYLSEPLRNAGLGPSIPHRLPYFVGAAAALGAFYNWNLTAMMQSDDVPARARQAQRRLFGESIHASTSMANASETLTYAGSSIHTQRKIVVVPQVAIAVLSLLILSAILTSVVFLMTRLSNRPLNLIQDPSTVVGTASQLPFCHPCPNLRNLNLASGKDIDGSFDDDRYRLDHEALRADAADDKNEDQLQRCSAMHSAWKPTPLRLWNISLIFVYIAALLIAVSILYHFAVQNRLYKTAFVYEATVRWLQSATFAPYSIIPTLMAIGVGLWWDTIDKTLRRLQPFLSMSKTPTPIDNGAGLSYQSSYVTWTASKALSRKHWLLAMITTGSIVCKILVIAMSALFEREHGVLTTPLQVNRLVEPRQIPYLARDWYNRVLVQGDRQQSGIAGRVLGGMFANAQTNWMYSATIQLALNGVEPSWSKSGWSFLPLTLPDLPTSSNASHVQNIGAATPEVTQPLSSTNFTFTTTATRARLECESIPQVGDVSTWLDQVKFRQFPNSTQERPVPIQTGYEVTHIMFGYRYTSLLAHPGRVSCCRDPSRENETQSVAIGYWSTTGDIEQWPNEDVLWPRNVTVKWLRGLSAAWPTNVEMLDNSTETSSRLRHAKYMFTQVPSLQALNCRPIIESATANVTVDYGTRAVQSFVIAGDLRPETSPWSDPFVSRKLTYRDDPRENDMITDVDVSTSYGVAFMNSLLGASDLEQLRGITTKTFGSQGNGVIPTDDLHLHSTLFNDEASIKDETFKIRDNSSGLNMDLMSYAMYTLADKDPDALLNATTMLRLANKVIQTYFQHFVSTNTAPNSTFGAYQPIGAEVNPVLLNASMMYDKMKWKPQTSYPQLNTSRTANGTVSTRIELLQMNAAATWISVVGLTWLLCTTVALLALQKRYLDPLLRDVETIADVFVLVAGSENFMKLIRETDPRYLVRNKQICTKLGWFRARDGHVRWGIEVVGDVGAGAVEWLDGPVGVVWEEKGAKERTWWERVMMKIRDLGSRKVAKRR
ncbi:hypothetical protein CC86DRAFT_405278 [Ophiobolus disseminans]|uniref:Uncharacterized protein n=1 Tax=Ophiobolus disseminans TaxID=1469910 RepID=A0A6A7A547_9PLEO|nr:hypothetical protein CC86DRAFT_405278 [Ophiobolus disseminans]